MGLGLNEGGAGTARFFLKQGANVLVTDLKTKKELWPSIKKLLAFKKVCGKKCGLLKFALGRHRKKDFKSADLIIQGPGVANDSSYLAIARQNRIPIDTDIGIFFENCPAPVIGITGSKGKSTTAALIYNILKQKFKDVILAGNIGKSPLDYIGAIKPTTKVVLELSSWQLEGLAKHKKSPHIAVITNILKEHLNRYKSFRHYARTKSLIFKYQKKEDYLVISRQAVRILQISAKNVKTNIRTYRERSGLIRISPDLDAACVVSKICGVSEKLIKKAVLAFKGLPGRQEKIARISGVSYYNDTTATMPDAAVLALNSIKPERDGKIILIAGGTDKKLDFEEMAREIVKRVGVLILLPGDATRKIKIEMRKISNFQFPIFKQILNRKIQNFKHGIEISNFKTPSVFEVKSMREAVTLSSFFARTGDIVILSPGAASFGLFKNEVDRGEQFIEWVMKLRNINK